MGETQFDDLITYEAKKLLKNCKKSYVRTLPDILSTTKY